MIVEIFTDGSSSLKKKKGVRAGASAYHIRLMDQLLTKGKNFEEGGTNNSAEAKAILLGLEKLDRMLSKTDDGMISYPVKINIYTDSLITCQACREWIYSWIKRSKDGVWRNSNGDEVANQETFKELYDKFLTNSKYVIHFMHVNSHVIDQKIYTDVVASLHKYYTNRHSQSNLKFDFSEELFTNEHFQKALASFKKKNDIEKIDDKDFLRLLLYNQEVDRHASKVLEAGIAKLKEKSGKVG